MEIYVNECSFHEQFFERDALGAAVRVFFNVLDAVRELGHAYRFYSDRNLLYKAFNQEILLASLNHLSDQSLRIAVFDVIFNKLDARDWKEEQVHSSLDAFTCDEDRVTDTSLAELVERRLGDNNLLGVVINFPSSKYADKLRLAIVKNGADALDLDCVNDKEQFGNWLNQVFESEGLAHNYEYDYESRDPPRDYQTLLRDMNLFEKTGRYQDERKVFKELETHRYWYVDNLHFGADAHLEVFDRRGKHLGEADLQGEINTEKRDAKKKIDP